MKFYDIFFGVLAYVLAYSCLSRKIMPESRFKGKFEGKISVFRNWVFGGLEAFPGYKKMKSRGCARTNIFTLLNCKNISIYYGIICIVLYARKRPQTPKFPILEYRNFTHKFALKTGFVHDFS